MSVYIYMYVCVCVCMYLGGCLSIYRVSLQGCTLRPICLLITSKHVSTSSAVSWPAYSITLITLTTLITLVALVTLIALITLMGVTGEYSWLGSSPNIKVIYSHSLKMLCSYLWLLTPAGMGVVWGVFWTRVPAKMTGKTREMNILMWFVWTWVSWYWPTYRCIYIYIYM